MGLQLWKNYHLYREMPNVQSREVFEGMQAGER